MIKHTNVRGLRATHWNPRRNESNMKTLVTILLAGLAASVSLATSFWVQPSDSVWDLAENWDPPQVPTSTNDVIIASGQRITIPDGYDATSRNLTLNDPSSDLWISNIGSLTVHGNYQQISGSLQVRSAAAFMNVEGDFLGESGLVRFIQGDKNSLIVTGDFIAANSLRFDFNMNNSDQGISRLFVEGSIVLEGAELGLRNFAHNNKDRILLMHNISEQPVNGFFDVPWGTTYTLNDDRDFQLMLIDYDGDGIKNDVALVSIEMGYVSPSSLQAAWEADHPGAPLSEYTFQSIPPFVVPLVVFPADSVEMHPLYYRFSQRRGADARGLIYRILHTTNLVHGSWSEVAIESVSLDPLDANFNVATTRVIEETDQIGFSRLRVSFVGTPLRESLSWTGLNGGSWMDPGQWNAGRVPISSDTVLINSVFSVMVSGGHHAEAGVLRLSDSELIVDSGGQVTVYGNLTVDGAGRMDVGSDAVVMVKGDLFGVHGTVRVGAEARDALVIRGDLNAGSDTLFDFDMNESSNGVGHIAVYGATRLDMAELALENFVHNGVENILLVHNRSDQDVMGSFAMPFGTPIDLYESEIGVGPTQRYELQLVDWDGDGVANDVVLRHQSSPGGGERRWILENNGEWNVASHWDPVGIPLSIDDAVIDLDYRVTVPNDYDAYAMNLGIAGMMSDLWISNRGFLRVHGDLQQNGGIVQIRIPPSRMVVDGDYAGIAGTLRVIQGGQESLIVGGDFTAFEDLLIDFNMNESPNSIQRVVVGGSTTLNGPRLNLRNFVHNGQDEILLIQNTSLNDVVGSFHADYPWGAVIVVEEDLFELKLIDYDGDGVTNDVALVRIPEPALGETSRYGLLGHGHVAANPTLSELHALAYYDVRQGTLPHPAMIDFVKAINPEWLGVQYVLFFAPMESHGQSAGFVERTDPNSIALSRPGVLAEEIDVGQTSFRINRRWNNPPFQFIPSTMGEGVYYNADETDQETHSVSNFVTWVRVEDEIMKVTGWDEEERILTVVRGIWGTEEVAHANGVAVFSPMYAYSGYPNNMTGNRYLRYAFNPIDSGLPVEWLLDGGIPMMGNNLTDAIASGSDGIWVDVCEPGWWFMTGVDGSGAGWQMWNTVDEEDFTESSFAIARNRQFHAIQTEWFNRHGVWPFIAGNSINRKWYWPEDANQRSYIESTIEKPRPVDFMSNENFVGSIDEAVVTFHDYDFWRDNVRMFMDAAQSDLAIFPFIVNAGTKGRTVSNMQQEDRERLELYGFASYLLGWEPDHPGTALGVDMLGAEVNGRKSVWVNPIFRLDIGVPLVTHGPDDVDEYQVPGHGTYLRSYSGGIVLVNPFPETDSNVPLGGTYWDPETGTEMDSVTMPPNTGRILLSDHYPSM